MKRLQIALFATLISLSASAQQWMRIHRTSNNNTWSIPLAIDGDVYYDIANKKLQGHFLNQDGNEIIVPWSISAIDSMDLAPDLTDEEKGHNHYRTFAMYIDTEDQTGITERDTWINCHISIDGMGEYSNFSGTGRIRGRGNSSWEWYDKKPYKFKLDDKAKILGLSKAKDWNLLANYRDPTDLMNAYAFETARYLGMPNTLHSRFLEVFLNGEYIGVYQLTEKIEVDDNRLNLDREGGVLLTLDQDDGPDLSPNDGDNFWTKVYNMPMAVKYPEDCSQEKLDSIKADFAMLESAIQAHNYDLVDSLLDIPSYIGLLQLHEYLYNVEIDAPRSIYLYRDKGGKYTFGPVWDWDAGYDFDWGDMYTGHTFFSNYKELIYGTDPVKNTGASYNINNFWRDMFNSSKFVTQYKQTWAEKSDSIYLQPWAKMEQFITEMNKGAFTREYEKWPLTKTESTGWWGGGSTTTNLDVADEISKMQTWLQNRRTYLNTVIAAYPAGSDKPASTTLSVKATIKKYVNVNYNEGYSQSGDITVSSSTIQEYLGSEALSSLSLVPLNADGSVGNNTAAGTYGAWFNDDGTCSWSNGHIFIESDDLYSWNYGCHPSNCDSGDSHTVRMQYRYDDGNEIKALNVEVICSVGSKTSGETSEEVVPEEGTDTDIDKDDDDDELPEGTTIAGTIAKTPAITFANGYSQDGTIEVSTDELSKYYTSTQLESLTLVPLNADGTEGSNTAAKTYGAWFNDDGTCSWSNGHVYIESNDLYTWNYGCHPSNCASGDSHTVTMQYRYTSGTSIKAVNVTVTFNVK